MNKKFCKQCGKELVRKVWRGNRKRIETNKRWDERVYCDNKCRSLALSELAKELNYFYGKHFVPWNKGKKFSDGWRVLDEKGYVRYFKGNGDWEYEHRIVASKYRDIGKDEVVHHINEDRSDNRPENLAIVKKKDHQRIHKGIYEGQINGLAIRGS